MVENISIDYPPSLCASSDNILKSFVLHLVTERGICGGLLRLIVKKNKNLYMIYLYIYYPSIPFISLKIIGHFVTKNQEPAPLLLQHSPKIGSSLHPHDHNYE